VLKMLSNQDCDTSWSLVIYCCKFLGNFFGHLVILK
jgi:hypothetical protein